MAIKIELFAAFADFAGGRDLTVNYRTGMTCLDVWAEVCRLHPKMASLPPLFAIEEEYVPADTKIDDATTLLLFPPLSGGRSSFIFETPLSVERAVQAVADPEAGGEAFFIGRVRRHSGGKTIRRLFYECRVPMAERQIERLTRQMFERWPLAKVHIEHRIGWLDVGEIAVIIAVSAAHRKEALEACSHAIDELKRTVPIWKKEVSVNGEEWA
jgi:molybdopterin synthase catalytic subunit/molybdopterin converting factor small subunit